MRDHQRQRRGPPPERSQRYVRRKGGTYRRPHVAGKANIPLGAEKCRPSNKPRTKYAFAQAGFGLLSG